MINKIPTLLKILIKQKGGALNLCYSDDLQWLTITIFAYCGKNRVVTMTLNIGSNLRVLMIYHTGKNNASSFIKTFRCFRRGWDYDSNGDILTCLEDLLPEVPEKVYDFYCNGMQEYNDLKYINHVLKTQA